MITKKFFWQDYAEWTCKAVAAFALSYGGLAIVERFGFGDVGQTFFWPSYAVLVYWTVIRDIHIRRPKPAVVPQASVRVRFKLEESTFGSNAERERVHSFGSKLDAALAAAGVGAYDGDEFGEGECVLFMYGPDAEAIYRTIAPLLHEESFLRGGTVELFSQGAQVALRTEML